ncbi:ionic transporter y4hA [Rhodococcus sp. T2V]|uniref:calcium:proton antiporter n=1 Tax=Rhodococcus sp. T2V TaxID=3034164 RepID=UPI0023E334D7|nr:ionic transporter y4hA [Rhodococcus sp. T2V]MDF3306804.1 ionic transporter y4hA [Rhodococcus sp. T2V]
MALRRRSAITTWPLVSPPAAMAVLAATWGRDLGPALVLAVALALIGAVLAAVHHAQVLARRVGEPFGSLIFAVAVTVIQVGMIVVLMISGGPQAASLARDTVFAAVMITLNGIVGLALFVGAGRCGVALFNAKGTGAALATVVSLITLSLVLPTFTSSPPRTQFPPAQLAFAAVTSLLLYGMFALTQTRSHRHVFPPAVAENPPTEIGPSPRQPTAAMAGLSLTMLVVAWGAAVGLAKVGARGIEGAVRDAALPQSLVGVVIALLVLAPNTLAAVRAAQRNQVQASLNLAFGSAMASIGLTIPVVAVASIWLDGPLLLGLGPTQLVLLALTVVVAVLTVVPGRATRLHGGLHLALLTAYVVLCFHPYSGSEVPM